MESEFSCRVQGIYPRKSDLLRVYNPKLRTSHLCPELCCRSSSQYFFHLCSSLSLFSVGFKYCPLGFVFASRFNDSISRTGLLIYLFMYFAFKPLLLAAITASSRPELAAVQKRGLQHLQSLSKSHPMMKQKQSQSLSSVGIKPIKFGINFSR